MQVPVHIWDSSRRNSMWIKKVNLKKKNILNLGSGEGGGLFCPPQINDSIQAVVQYLYQSILFMNEGGLQLTIRTKTNYPLTSQWNIQT